MAKSRVVEHGHCSNALIAQGFIGIVIMVKLVPLVGMSSVVLSDLSGCDVIWMYRNS
jgi:hypothetical protein